MSRHLLLGIIASIAAVLLSSSAARANNLFSLDTSPARPGHVIEDANGNAYIAWVHAGQGGAPDAPRFCKIAPGGTCTAPNALPIPLLAGELALSASDSVNGAFPLFGTGATVYVVAPRYVQQDVVLYTSTNAGQSFDNGVVIPKGMTVGAEPYPAKTNPTAVMRSGSNFLIGADNPGLGFSSFGASQGNFGFTSPGPGGVAGSTMALDASGNPVIAYFNLSAPQYSLSFYRYGGSGPMTLEANWIGPSGIANGDEPNLSGGASGLFLVSDDYATGASPEPTVLTVRKYGAGTFGAPITLGNDPTTLLFDGGAIAQSPSGKVAVAWPTTRASDGARVMRLYTSTNGGTTFAASLDIAHIGPAYGIGDNAQLAPADDGSGWLTFLDSGGLEVADFNVPASVPTPPRPTSLTGQRAAALKKCKKKHSRKKRKKCKKKAKRLPV